MIAASSKSEEWKLTDNEAERLDITSRNVLRHYVKSIDPVKRDWGFFFVAFYTVTVPKMRAISERRGREKRERAQAASSSVGRSPEAAAPLASAPVPAGTGADPFRAFRDMFNSESADGSSSSKG